MGRVQRLRDRSQISSNLSTNGSNDEVARRWTMSRGFVIVPQIALELLINVWSFCQSSEASGFTAEELQRYVALTPLYSGMKDCVF